jgi:1-deoxyxylulose-5-phosphate synthase
MDYVNLGMTGLKVSRICLGCMTYGQPATGKIKPGSHAWALNEEDSQPFLRQSLDLGITFSTPLTSIQRGPAKRFLDDFCVHILAAKP